MVDSIPGSVAVFIGAAAVITLCGIRLANLADRLADKTGWGEALMGGLFLAGNLIQAGLFIVLLVAYLFGYHLVRRDLDTPMWQPRRTAQTVVNRPDGRRIRSQTLSGLWFHFALMASLTGAAGWLLMSSAESLMKVRCCPRHSSAHCLPPCSRRCPNW